MAHHHPHMSVSMAMDCTALDLRKTKEVSVSPRLSPLNYSPPPAPHQPYSPLTPPYNTPAPPPPPPTTAPYQTMLPLSVVETSDSDETSLSSSPPGQPLVSSTYMLANNVINTTIGRNGRPTRPFKAYPKDPLSFSTAPSVILGQDSTEEYMVFRQRMLAQLEVVSGRNNSNMKRSISPQMPSSTAEMDDKTAAYWERRRKNNEAAKRSRDARRAKEDEIAIRAAFLEQENMKLKYELASLRSETAKLRCLVYNR